MSNNCRLVEVAAIRFVGGAVRRCVVCCLVATFRVFIARIIWVSLRFVFLLLQVKGKGVPRQAEVAQGVPVGQGSGFS
jgi:hypothetical protein